MSYEVELKYPLADVTALETQLNQLGASRVRVEHQSDCYFAHPVRDFAATDEALRMRSIGDENRLTYKGPVIDRATKTRHESELTFQSGSAAAEQFAEIWKKLGFRQVRTVRKERQIYILHWQDRDLEICLDQVDGLGSYLEIETIASESDKAAAQQAILSLAGHLNLQHPESRSYLEMVLAAENEPSA